MTRSSGSTDPTHGESRGLAVRLAGVGVSFAGARRVEALRDLDLDVEPGSFTAIIGPNGCGKSTSLRLIAGLLPPTSGSVALGEPGSPPR
ncbi:MAG TPA: ATP-binding cassette domain-containing protein, partial [Candidatus Limnocylindria bacterium]|nr:ATP-binding cassette domain-containing protein [Candidatus Limnocylindria bacterium]